MPSFNRVAPVLIDIQPAAPAAIEQEMAPLQGQDRQHRRVEVINPNQVQNFQHSTCCSKKKVIIATAVLGFATLITGTIGFYLCGDTSQYCNQNWQMAAIGDLGLSATSAIVYCYSSQYFNNRN